MSSASLPTKPIKTALISVFYKDGLEPLIKTLASQGVKLLSTGGTRAFIEGLGLKCDAVEDLTGYPSILGGRVKTLHPKVFGGILARRDNADDAAQTAKFDIPDIDLVVVDLYPFEATVASGAPHDDIIEKIDIGGISLIRAAAKNYKDVAIVASKGEYPMLAEILERHGAATTIDERRTLAGAAFNVTNRYDRAIASYFASTIANHAPEQQSFDLHIEGSMPLRYGENPHQEARFFGDFEGSFTQLHGKEISYNNLLDIDAAVGLIGEFEGEPVPTFAILKHNNACGVATRPTVVEAWKAALEGDPVSAFGGVLICNHPIDLETANEIDKIFFEVIVAPGYSDEALEVLKHKKNRIILHMTRRPEPITNVRSCLGGVLVQQRDLHSEAPSELESVTERKVTAQQVADLLFANKIVKHSKSNAIVLAKNCQLLASGVGQTSRVDALKQAIEKAGSFKLDLKGASMASDAFFPFADCVEIAHAAGIESVIHPGGSIRDQESVDFCNAHNMAMVKTGIRHFKH